MHPCHITSSVIITFSSLNVLEKLNPTLPLILSSKIDHPHCVPIIETFATKHYAYIVMEMCKGGELFDAITEEVI